MLQDRDMPNMMMPHYVRGTTFAVRAAVYSSCVRARANIEL